MIERYRYDALGRRVLTHTFNNAAPCNIAGCESILQRTIWDGDQVLYEIRANGDTTLAEATLERDTPGGNGIWGTTPTANMFGVVGYTHAGGIDQPLGVLRMSYGSLLAAFYPHSNWRGLYEAGTLDDGSKLTNNIAWPGVLAGVWLGATPNPTPYEWFGNLITDQADASGLLYRRNRYYDPKSGRFTQPDPIGIAGGLNAYGFGGGDPVSYSDPFGLWPSWRGVKEGVGDWWHDVKRDVGIRIIKVIIDVAGWKEGEKIEPIDPEPPPVVVPAPGKPGGKKDPPKKPDSSTPNPMQRFREFLNRPVNLPTLPPLLPTPGTDVPVWLPPPPIPILIPE